MSVACDECFFPVIQRSCKEFVTLHGVSQVFKPARTAREKVGNWKSSLKFIEDSHKEHHDKTMGFWSSPGLFSDNPNTFLTSLRAADAIAGPLALSPITSLTSLGAASWRAAFYYHYLRPPSGRVRHVCAFVCAFNIEYS